MQKTAMLPSFSHVSNIWSDGNAYPTFHASSIQADKFETLSR